MRPKNFSLGIRFSLTVGVILFLFCGFFSVILYHYLKTQVIKDAKEKTVIIMTHVKAVGGYVKDSLRPKMFELLSKTKTEEEFILEAMSTTHVNLQVMKRFKGDLPQYVFKRVSDAPLNPENLADEFHANLMRFFAANRERESWQGIVSLGGKEALVYTRPVVSDPTCLRCHGDPKGIPASFYAKYGKAGRFGWKEGAVVGVESISIPLHLAFAQIKRVALDTFLFGISMLGLLFLALFGIFRHLVTKPLHNITDIFKNIAEGKEPLGKDIPYDKKDEIGDLTASFNLLGRHLLEAQERLKQTAEIEKNMMATEKLAALGQLSAGVAHEINNPLGGIRLCFTNLMHSPMDEEKRRQHIEVINAGFDRIQAIVKNLLDVSKNAPLSVAPVALNHLVESVLSLTEYTIGKKGVTLEKKLSPECPELMADANKLEQVFLNLLINALQAMAPGGVLTIETRREADACSVAVSDTGGGIPAEILTRIFDPFFTTKGMGEGTGLGLTVSKSIVEQHRGTIAVTTSPQGSTFTVRLPLK